MNFCVHFYVQNLFKFFFLSIFFAGAVLKPPSSNMTQKFSYILLDICEFFQILESGDSICLFEKIS